MDRNDLEEWASEVNWGEYIDDDDVYHTLLQLKSTIDRINGGDSEDNDAFRIKLVACGDGAVGKTSLLISYAEGTFPEGYVPTVFENYAKTVEYNGEKVYLHLWDTAGQEEYDRLRPLSYPGADIVILCFSLVTDSTFESIQEKWYPEVEHYIPDVPVILVGTKLDLREKKIPDPSTNEFAPVSKKQGEELAKDIGALAYFELSAKTGENVDELFLSVIEQVKSHHVEEGSGVQVRPRKGNKKKERGSGCHLL